MSDEKKTDPRSEIAAKMSSQIDFDLNCGHCASLFYVAYQELPEHDPSCRSDERLLNGARKRAALKIQRRFGLAKESEDKTVVDNDGGRLTHEEAVKAASNIGFDLTCGLCASVFYTGYPAAQSHDLSCRSDTYRLKEEFDRAFRRTQKRVSLAEEIEENWPSDLKRLREAGWVLSAHYDLGRHQRGGREPIETTWIFTDPVEGAFVRGDGSTDGQAVYAALREAGLNDYDRPNRCAFCFGSILKLSEGRYKCTGCDCCWERGSWWELDCCFTHTHGAECLVKRPPSQ